MKANRQINQIILSARHRPRRVEPRVVTLVLALALLLLATAPAGAMGTTQAVATPGTADGVSFLFVQVFSGGTWEPKEGVEGTYRLTLHDVGVETIYFTDRPAHHVGLVPTDKFLGSLGFTSNYPPNAALTVQTENGAREVIVVELYSPVYDVASGTLTYDAVLLQEYDEAALATLAQRATGDPPAPSFGSGQLFIDSTHCKDPTGSDWMNCLPI